MNTDLVYLENTYLFKGESKLIEIVKDDKGFYAILDKTIFYPQGGGQESDIGQITLVLDSGQKLIKDISSVGYSNGEVRHYGNFHDIFDITNCSIHMDVNSSVRLFNSKLHTAGHLIASIVEEMNLGLRAIKGFHFKTGSYIGFEKIENIDFDYVEIKEMLNLKIRESINKDLKISSEKITMSRLKEICNYVPSYLPKDKPLRVVTIQNYQPIPCGGTHIKSLAEIQNLEVTKIKSKKGNVRMSYSLM